MRQCPEIIEANENVTKAKTTAAIMESLLGARSCAKHLF